MNEHTPLTETERLKLAFAVYSVTGYVPPKNADDLSSAKNEIEHMVERIIAARTSAATADTEGCWQPCDPDCEVGPVHCEAVHLPSHKAKTVLHTAECVATADTGLRERVEAVETHNGTPITPENLRWAATHEALCRSWIFDVLTGLADALDATATTNTERESNA
jgi:hypothetical protein